MPETPGEYPAYARAVIDRNPQMNESNTKLKLLNPLLDALGWNVATEVELEYSVQMGATTKHVDYSLTHEGSPAVFVEAKGCDSTLSEGDRTQLASYLKQQNVDWGLLTNGKQFEVLRRRFDGTDIVVDTLGSFPLEEFASHVGLVEALSKESITSGQSDRIAAAMRELHQARDALQDEKETLAERIAQAVAEVAGDRVSQRAENHAKEYIDALVADIESDLQSTPARTDGQSQQVDFWTRVEAQTGIRRTEDGVTFPDGPSATSSYVSFVRLLFDEDYLSVDDLPIQLGRTRYTVHTEPEHPDGREMYEAKEVVDGVYLETHASVAQLQSYTRQLAAFCGAEDAE